jgi:hypothetical protein
MDLPISARPPAHAGWVPVDDLFATSLTAVERTPGTGTLARLVLAGDQTLPERVRSLAAAETACCSFFAFMVTPLPGDDGGTTQSVTLDVVVPAAHADVLTALVNRAEQARGAAA